MVASGELDRYARQYATKVILMRPPETFYAIIVVLTVSAFALALSGRASGQSALRLALDEPKVPEIVGSGLGDANRSKQKKPNSSHVLIILM